MKKVFLSNIILSALLLSGCGSSVNFVSNWPEQPIQIDGSSQDWQGHLQAHPKENYSIGFKNDGKFLYICFITADRNKIQTIMRSGLNVAFDSPTEVYKNYTITFPVVSPGSFKEQGETDLQEGEKQDGKPEPFKDLLNKQFQFNLLEKDFVNNIPLNNKENIELKMGVVNENLVYELKVPLSKTKSSYTIGAAPGEIINIKFKTQLPKMGSNAAARVDREMAEGQTEGGPPPGARGGRGRGGRGVDVRALRGMNASEFEADFTVQLTKEAIKN